MHIPYHPYLFAALLALNFPVSTFTQEFGDPFIPLRGVVPGKITSADAGEVFPTSVGLAWDSPASQFRVYSSPNAEPFALHGTSTNLVFQAGGIVSGRQYRFYITAVTASGESGPSNTVTYEIPPKSPANLKLAAASGNRVKVTWKDRSAREAGYVVERSVTSATAGFSIAGTVPANTAVFFDTAGGTQTGKQYWFRVRATGYRKFSAYSNTAVIQP